MPRSLTLVLAGVFAALLLIGTSSASAVRGTATAGDRVEVVRAPASSSALIKRVTIGGTRYWLLNAVKAVGFVRSPYAKIISAVVRACPTAASWGFWGKENGEYGIVAYLPGNPKDCYGVIAGGPQTRSPCAQVYRTPDLRFWVGIAGTSTSICADMSTQAPGGRAATTTDVSDSGTFDAETDVWVTCQEIDQGLLWDYITPRFGNEVKFPLSREADWILDEDVDTGYADWIPTVPTCSGVDVRW